MKKSTGCLVGLLVLAAGAGGAWWKVNAVRREREHLFKWGAIVMPERVARVPEAWPVETLSQRLKATGKVRDAEAFQAAALQVGLKSVEPGGYRLPEKAGPLELARIFHDGPTLAKVTFPEGFTAAQIAARLERNKFEAASQFEQLAYPNDGTSPLEGYLFPDTYLLPLRGSASQLADRMRDRARKTLKTLPRPFPVNNGEPMSQDDVVTLASLVERETNVPSERPLVAGVLLNRLRKGMRLQCDASVLYALQRHALATGTTFDRPLLRTDYQFASPFNTYLNAGLPPAPICNPGEASLRAAAAPKSSPYFFYMLSPQLGRHRFAKTFEEHKRNIRLAQQERAQ